MSGDGQMDVMITMVFLFGAEAKHLMEALRVHSHVVVYIGHSAKQPGMLLSQSAVYTNLLG